ncbi:hypothetical protein GCM10010149_67670 [Nonomuraea roseoviolacea subsp. roseoviolacea]
MPLLADQASRAIRKGILSLVPVACPFGLDPAGRTSEIRVSPRKDVHPASAYEASSGTWPGAGLEGGYTRRTAKCDPARGNAVRHAIESVQLSAIGCVNQAAF